MAEQVKQTEPLNLELGITYLDNIARRLNEVILANTVLVESATAQKNNKLSSDSPPEIYRKFINIGHGSKPEASLADINPKLYLARRLIEKTL